ncbi:CpaD family pilus assembly protein [Insolitispirillum peregrinum]|uniref:Pilus assembly protein CpaD n=1 Tax=Insolitispirillum peregrinum TaxID=80876 RepID=A0A1N7QCG0_9PROT|nr:CpaD family pilus assembly lipoprotein [Insolitispirillum peregrinum]SIT20562.1 pilus assembly protein CpaD [Insolitispirillum peregrinum]
MPCHTRLALVVAVLTIPLSACTQELNSVRADMFANPPQPGIEVKPSAVSLNLRTTPAGQSFTPESLKKLNELLNRQGRLGNQTITLLPYTPAGGHIAERLSQVLTERGLPPSQLILRDDLRDAGHSGGDDLMIVSEAIVAVVPDCSIAGTDSWAVTPYSAVGPLGCANRANLARMVSDPRDLVRPRTLDPADGTRANAAIQRYHTDSVRDLVDIDFDD